MKVSKCLCALLVLLSVFCFMTGCYGEKELTAEQIGKELEELCLKGYETFEVSKADIENRFNFDGNLLGDYYIKMCQTEERYLMVAVLEPNQEKDRAEIIAGIKQNVKDASASFSILGTAELSNIQQRLLYEYEEKLILVIGDNYTSAKSYLEKIGATPVV